MIIEFRTTNGEKAVFGLSQLREPRFVNSLTRFIEFHREVEVTVVVRNVLLVPQGRLIHELMEVSLGSLRFTMEHEEGEATFRLLPENVRKAKTVLFQLIELSEVS